MGILGGSLFGIAQADFTFLRYLHASIDSLLLRDITTGLCEERHVRHHDHRGRLLEGLSTGAGRSRLAGPRRGPWSCPSSWSLSSICFLPLSSFSQAADDHEPDVPRRHLEPVISLHDLRVSYGERRFFTASASTCSRRNAGESSAAPDQGKAPSCARSSVLKNRAPERFGSRAGTSRKTSTAEMDAIRRKIGMSFQAVLSSAR